MDLKDLPTLEDEVDEREKPETEVEFESDTDMEQELTDALSLLEDCQTLLSSLLAFKESRKISIYAFDEIKRLSDETCWHLAQYDADGELSGNVL